MVRAGKALHLEQLDDPVVVLGGPIFVIARALVPDFDPEPGACWNRACYRNGLHRWFGASVIGEIEIGRVAEVVLQFDELMMPGGAPRVGQIVGLTDLDLHRPQDPFNLVGMARLMSVAAGTSCTHEGQAYIMQRWQTLGMANRG